ncbi:chemotaxis protein CheW [Halobacteria archaeon AArc-dxtr1]|nr:chemotaxis protein CheW [Halobacteria archaeon AArc-dxtr1]
MPAQEFDRESADGETPAGEHEAVEALEFELNEQVYCVEIGYVAEIVNCGELTTIPNSPPHIEGVVALRDEAIKVINLKELFELDGEYADTKLIVFKRRDDADSRLGWLVDGVVGVTTFSRSEVESASGKAGLEGVVQRDEQFLLWFDPAEVRI